jgi:hypothetical protein
MVRRRLIPKIFRHIYDFCQRASFGILDVKIPARKPGIPNSTIFSRTAPASQSRKYPAEQIVRSDNNGCNTSCSAFRQR